MRTELEAMTAYIEAHPGIIPVALAEHLGVSVRTVRTYVKQANDAMHGVGRIQLSRKNGFRLQVSDQAAYEAWHSKEKSETPPQTPKDRVTYLLNDLLMRSDWVKLNDLSNALFVSRATITNDLKRAQKILDDYDLSIESRPHYGIRIVGPELSRRVCLANVIVNRYNNAMGDVESETTRTLSWLSSDLGSEDATSDPTLRVISSCVERVLQAEKFQINTASYRNLIVHIAVALVRIEENCYVPMAPEQIDQLKGRREFKVAQAIAAEIESALGSSCTLPEEEVAYIAIHLAERRGPHGLHAVGLHRPRIRRHGRDGEALRLHLRGQEQQGRGHARALPQGLLRVVQAGYRHERRGPGLGFVTLAIADSDDCAVRAGLDTVESGPFFYLRTVNEVSCCRETSRHEPTSKREGNQASNCS